MPIFSIKICSVFRIIYIMKLALPCFASLQSMRPFKLFERRLEAKYTNDKEAFEHAPNTNKCRIKRLQPLAIHP